MENMAYDDKYTLNTQSGTQWDGFRHVRPDFSLIYSVRVLSLHRSLIWLPLPSTTTPMAKIS